MRQQTEFSPYLSLIRTFTSWLLVAISLLLFLDISGGALTLFLEQRQNSVENATGAMVGDIDTLLSSMIDQETGLRGYITTADPLFLEPFYQGRYVYSVMLPHLVLLLRDEGFSNTSEAFTRFVALSKEWSTTFAPDQLHLMEMKNYVEARSVKNGLQGKALFDRFRQATQSLKGIVNVDMAELRSSTISLKNGLILFTILFSALFLLLLWFIAHRNITNLKKQLQIILFTMLAYGQGDNRRRIEPLKYQELQNIALGFNDMVGTLEHQKEELHQQQQSLRVLADTLPQIVWTSCPDGSVDYYNQKWFDYTGMTLEQTQGWGWEPVLHPDDVQPAQDVLKQAMAQGESYEIELRMKRASDGMYRWHLTRALPIRDSEGTIIKWFGTSTDIDDLKRAEHVLIQTNQDQQNFVSTVSHEFRTTLTSIQGFSELLGSEDFQREEVKEYATDIYQDATRLNRMITDLLDLEKMQSGHTTLLLEEVDVNALVSEVVEKMNFVSAQHCIDLKLDKNVPMMSVDPDKMIQVVYNLLSNAVKYSPKGGHILVETTREESQIHICVHDQGMGIPKEALEKIFSPYNRVHAEDTRYIKGTGLGLPIVHRIVEMHGGRVWVESTLGQGSIFHVLVPLAQPALVTAEK